MFKKTISFFVVSLFAAGLMIGCGAASSRPSPFKSNELQFTSPQNGDTIAIFDTSMGTFRAVLFPALAPLAVENFVTLAKQGYYDGILFHHVVKDFVIQGGDPTATGGGGESIWGNPFADEFTDSLHNYTGALSMANSGENTNTSQFFIVDAPADSVSAALAGQMKTGGYRQEVIDAYRAVGGAPYLDGKHTVFGQIYSGMDVIDKIASVAVDEKTDRPKKDIVIESISIDTYQQDTSSSN
ncbi:MAG: peptidylprolyl isomerase [Pygmaiobacter sp.]|nr:peptidylprolyl isomerase [Pygmaiobacter sp.]